MALTYAYPEAEGAVRAWVRSLNIAGLGQRAFFGIPTKATFPLVVVARVAGRPLRGVPVDRPIIQFDVLGETPVAGQPPKDKMALSTIANKLVDEAESLVSGTLIAASVVCLGAEVENGPVWSPNVSRQGVTADGRSRYTLDIAFKLRKA